MDSLTPATLAALRLHLADLTPRQRALAERAAGGLEGLAALTGASRVLAQALGAEAARRFGAITRACVEDELARADRRGARACVRGGPGWPPLLSEIADPPAVLWVRGALPEPALPSLVVVGPRRPSPYGLAVARDLCRHAAERGVVIVSGGARGVDGAAHAAALVARRPTVAVLGCGVDVPYPREHRPLYDRIEEDGAVVSEHPCGTQPRPHHFPIRNRILAGWSRAVLIPEGSVESGSLITARLALEAGREVLAVPGPITSRLSEGPNALIAEGARLVRGPADVLAELGLAAEPAPAAPADPVLALLPPGEALDLDALVERSGRPASELLALLGGLEARGQAFGLPGGRWLRAGPS